MKRLFLIIAVLAISTMVAKSQTNYYWLLGGAYSNTTGIGSLECVFNPSYGSYYSVNFGVGNWENRNHSYDEPFVSFNINIFFDESFQDSWYAYGSYASGYYYGDLYGLGWGKQISLGGVTTLRLAFGMGYTAEGLFHPTYEAGIRIHVYSESGPYY